MSFKPLFCLLAATCVFSLGFAQCPDSVHVYVNPQVICPGEVAHLSTDSTLLHCVNIGDIICVNSNTQDTAIVSPSDWTRLNLASTYTPLSVVFYVDETCQHGWAVEARNTAYEKKAWYSFPLGYQEQIPNIDNIRSSLMDINGHSNTIAILTGPNYVTPYLTYYQAFNSASSKIPFYLPALGQLNILFSVKDRISQIISDTLSTSYQTIPNDNWWSSTQKDNRYSYYLSNSGIISSNYKTINTYYVIPVMNF